MAYFENVPHARASSSQIAYENSWTGVEFVFDLQDDPLEPLALGLNLVRPSTFGLEAAGVLERLVVEFKFQVHDEDAETTGDFDRRAFVDTWNAANSAACTQARQTKLEPHQTLGLYTLPRATLIDHWRWNSVVADRDLSRGLATSQVRYRVERGAIRTYVGLEVDRPVAIVPVDDVLLICAMDGLPLLESADKATMFVPFPVVDRYFALEPTSIDGIACDQIASMGDLAEKMFHRVRPPQPPPFGSIEPKFVIDRELLGVYSR